MFYSGFQVPDSRFQALPDESANWRRSLVPGFMKNLEPLFYDDQTSDSGLRTSDFGLPLSVTRKFELSVRNGKNHKNINISDCITIS